MGAFFHIVDSTDSLFIEGIGTEAVNGIGGEGDYATLSECRDSAADLFFYSELFRHLGQVTSALRT